MAVGIDHSRRNFFRGRRPSEKVAVRLPWLKSEQALLQECTQCTDCLSACETQIIVKGEGGFPTVDFTKGECTFCQQCALVCKEPIFVEDLTQQPWQVEAVIKDSCLAKNQILCQSCQDSCEPYAISFQYLQSSVPQPRINQVDCNGCGACVSVCPQSAIEIKPIDTSTTLAIGE